MPLCSDCRAYVELNSRTALAYSSVALINSALRLFASGASAFLSASRASFTLFVDMFMIGYGLADAGLGEARI